MRCCLPDMGLLPVLEGSEHVTVVVDGFQDLCQRHIVPLRKQIPKRIGIAGIERRGGDMECPVSADFQMRVVGGTLIRRPVLSVKRGIQLRQNRLKVGKLGEARPFQKMRFLLLPAFLIDQIRVHRAVFVGAGKVQIAGFDRAGDMLEQQHLVE